MIGAREETIYWQQQCADEYRLARRAYDRRQFKTAVLYQISAAHTFDAYLQEMERMDQP